MQRQNNNSFSIFDRGYRNKAGKAVPQNKPLETQTIEWVGEYIKSERAREATQLLRNLKVQETSEAEQKERELKVLSFMYATFSGIFSYRKTDGLLMRSPFICLDFDDLASLDEAKSLREQLSADSHIETELCFVSPRGHGVKWVVTLPERTLGMTFKEQFEDLQKSSLDAAKEQWDIYFDYTSKMQQTFIDALPDEVPSIPGFPPIFMPVPPKAVLKKGKELREERNKHNKEQFDSEVDYAKKRRDHAEEAISEGVKDIEEKIKKKE